MADDERLLNSDPPAPTGAFDTVIRPAMAEFVGVCLFVFVGVMSTTTGDIADIGLAHGLTIALLIMGLGEISGGHFNPAVTLGVTLSGAISPLLAIAYFFAQIFGGMLGAAFVRATLPAVKYSAITGGTHQLGAGVESGWAILIEAILTTVLVFTVLMAAVDSKTKTNLAPLAIGFAVAVDILSCGELTGASMNPARAFGPAVAASAVTTGAWKYHYIYWVGPLCGSLTAACLYRFFFASPSKRWIARMQRY